LFGDQFVFSFAALETFYDGIVYIFLGGFAVEGCGDFEIGVCVG
jgi:hypothetical protein